MIIVDSSAIVAILFGEPMAAALLQCLATDQNKVMSVASYVETGAVLAGRRRTDRLRAIDHLDTFLNEADILLEPVDAVQARIALRARIQYGRGMGHGGVLNFGDAFSYALAQRLEAPLLFIGDDFGTTDVIAALSTAANDRTP
jgi:ribonuclease VapC